MNDSVVAIVSAFFIIGITVGVIVVIALSVLRAERRHHPGKAADHGPSRPGRQPPDVGWQDAISNHHPHWPGDTDNDFSDR